MVFGLGVLGSIVTAIKSKKQGGAITNSQENVPFGNLKKNKGEINYNYFLTEADNFSDLPEGLKDFTYSKSPSPSITTTKTNTKSSSLLGRSQLETGDGDLTSKEGINTTTLMIIGGTVVLAIFILPMFFGGKK